jgi:uncharacterized protein
METIPANLLQEIVQRLVLEFDPDQIILFGSHAWGKPNADSDVDICVIVSNSAERPTRRATRAYRCLRGIGVPVEVIVKTQAEIDRFSGVRASLEAEILTRGKFLYGQSQTRSGTQLAAQGFP